MAEKFTELKKTIQNGKLTVRNVPHLYANSEQAILSSKTLYSLTFVFQHMIRNQIKEFDFDNVKELKSAYNFLFEGENNDYDEEYKDFIDDDKL